MVNIIPEEVNLHPYAAAIFYHLKDKDVEVYLGDNGMTFLFQDHETTQKSIIRGKVIDVMGDCIILLCKKNDKETNVFVNVWAVKTFVKIGDPLFTMDVFQNEENRVRNLRK